MGVNTSGAAKKRRKREVRPGISGGASEMAARGREGQREAQKQVERDRSRRPTPIARTLRREEAPPPRSKRLTREAELAAQNRRAPKARKAQPDKDGGGFLESLFRPKGRREAQRHAVTAGRVGGRVAYETEKGILKALVRSAKEDPTTFAGPAGLAGSRFGQELTVGPEVTKASRGEKYDPRWAAVEAAGIVPFFRPLRALRAGRAAKKAAEAGGKVAAAPKARATETSLAGAQTRLADLDKEYDKAVKKLMPMFKPDPRTIQTETALRNIARRKRKTANLPTINEEARKQAEDALSLLAEREPGHPIAKMYRERETLRGQVNAYHEALFGGESAVPKLELPGELAGPSARERVREAFGPARARIAATRGLRREETATRLAKAKAAQEAAGGGIAGTKAAKAQFRGEMPKVPFQHLREGKLSEGELEQLYREIDDHPDLDFFQKWSAKDGLLRAWNQEVPQKAQLRHLQTVFGEDAVEPIAKWGRIPELAVDLANVPRSLMSTADVSFPLRQGIVVAHSYPGIFARGFKPMFKSLVSEADYAKVEQSIIDHPEFELAKKAGVAFSELGGVGKVGAREEQFASSMAERIPGMGRVVRASGRAYTAAANVYRMEIFSRMLAEGKAAGHNVESRKFQKSAAAVANTFTGRGTGGEKFERAAPVLNNVFFSPRLIRARINMLNPMWYARLDPYARKQAAKALVRMTGTMAVLLAAADQIPGVEVGKDPRSADFAKIKIGNTRIDLGGGFQQYIRFVAQMVRGELVSSTTGKEMKLGPGFGEMSRLQIAGRFAQSKLAPPPSFFVDFLAGTDFANEPFEVKKAVYSRLYPMLWGDIADLYRETGSVPAAAAGGAIGALGASVATYGNTPVERVKSKHEEWGDKFREGMQKTGLLKGDKLPQELEYAIGWRRARYQHRAKVGADDTRERFEADIDFIFKHQIPHRDGWKMTKEQRDRSIAWVQHQERDRLVERELRRLSDWYFDGLYGDVIADTRQELFERGYDLPRAPR